MIADSSPVDASMAHSALFVSSLIRLPVFFRWFAQCLAVEREAVRGVHEAVEDGISDCGITEHR
jgi:hypothetical protein